MLLGVTIWSPGETLLIFSIFVGVLWHYWKKYTASNPEVGAAVKKAAATKAIGLIGKWLK